MWTLASRASLIAYLAPEENTERQGPAPCKVIREHRPTLRWPHVERLQDRGLHIDAIRDVLARIDRGIRTHGEALREGSSLDEAMNRRAGRPLTRMQIQ